MNPVFTARQLLITCLVVVTTGCATRSRDRRNSSATDSPPAPSQLERVAESPRLAPPPLSSPEFPGSSRFTDTWIPLGRWVRENGYGTLRQISPGPAPAYALSTSNGVFFLQPGSLVAAFDGLELHLGFAPQLIDNQPFVHRLDLKKNLEPVIRGFSPPTKTSRIVVIDPGHGGQNTGARSTVDGLFEKDFTLDWALRLQPLLVNEGWQAFLTRTNDADVSLSERVAFAQGRQADLFVSLHFNSAAPSQEQSGVETYCLTPAGMPSTLTRGYDDDLSAVFANNAFDAENLQYAILFHRALLSIIGNDRGVRHARFLGVLRGQNRPAVLIEGGYLSNPAEARRIADPAYLQTLAEAVAAVLGPNPKTGGRNLEMTSRPSAPGLVSENLAPAGLTSSNFPAGISHLP